MRKFLMYGLIGFLALLAMCGVFFAWYVRTLGPRLRARTIQALSERFDADVQLGSLQVTVYPSPSVTGSDLFLRHKGWPDTAPLLFIRQFTASTDYATLFNRRNEVSLVRLDGLRLHISRHEGLSLSGNGGKDKLPLRFLIHTIVADGTQIVIEPKEPGKDPLVFDLHKLTLRSVGPGEPLAFTAQLTNPKPPGLIDSSGQFGPWQADDPRSTPVSGEYSFQNADLSVFTGIGGILSSKGAYQGVLQKIEVNGTTDTPAFTLKTGGAPVPLTTRFHAIVDGANGDTILDPVLAHFLNSSFLCKGGIVRQPGDPGKTVDLHALTQGARIEDILQLLVGDRRAFLMGDVDFSSRILIPPGHQPVVDKLALDGRFELVSARFASPKIEGALTTLSERAEGIPKRDAPEDGHTVASNFEGRFKLDKGTASFSVLRFEVPGAQVNLAGTYGLRSERIHMDGVFRMQATLAETQSGFKRWLLKPLDPLFRKDGAGFELPVHIAGTKSDPEFGVTIFHKTIMLNRK